MLQHRFELLGSPKCGWWTWYTDTSVGHPRTHLKLSCMSDDSYINPQTALHQINLFHRSYFRCSWSMSPYLPSVSSWEWGCTSNATTLQVHIKHIWGNQPSIAVWGRELPHPEGTSNVLMPSRTQKRSSFNLTMFQQQSYMLVQLWHMKSSLTQENKHKVKQMHVIH